MTQKTHLRTDRDERLRFMADMMPQLVWVARPDGQVEYFNKMWYDYTGQLPRELADESQWTQPLHPDDRVRAGKGWTHAVETGEDYEIEYRFRNAKTGEYRWFVGRARPYRNAEGVLTKWYGTCTDIHDQKIQAQTLEQMVAERTAQLQESNRELESFAYAASHDLQEPLRKIQAFGDLLGEEYGEQLGDGKLYLERMRSAASRMSLLIEDLLEFSRVSSRTSPTEPVALTDVIADVIDDLDSQIRRTKGEVRVEGQLPVLQSSPIHMRQLFQNLLTNALKFHKPDQPPIVTIGARSDDDLHEITVSDNGIGFEQKYADKIFAVFQRLHGKNQYDGTGIGLAICRKIVLRYGGTIIAESTPGVGTRFIIRFPARSDATHNKETL
jgi:PAS domain S-box-containing protein